MPSWTCCRLCGRGQQGRGCFSRWWRRCACVLREPARPPLRDGICKSQPNHAVAMETRDFVPVATSRGFPTSQASSREQAPASPPLGASSCPALLSAPRAVPPGAAQAVCGGCGHGLMPRPDATQDAHAGGRHLDLGLALVLLQHCRLSPVEHAVASVLKKLFLAPEELDRIYSEIRSSNVHN